MAGENPVGGKPEKPKKLSIDFLINIPIPVDTLVRMDEHDRNWLSDLSIPIGLPGTSIISNRSGPSGFTIRLEDVLRVRNMLRKYNALLIYPESATLQKYGLKHSAKDSLEIFHDGDVYEIRQYYPNGQISTYRIPKDIVETVYGVVVKIFTDRPDLEKIDSKDLWEPLCRKFDLQRYFDWRGRFHSNSFFGDRSQYFRFFYYPCRILSHLSDGRIIYRGPVITLPARKPGEQQKPAKKVINKTLTQFDVAKVYGTMEE